MFGALHSDHESRNTVRMLIRGGANSDPTYVETKRSIWSGRSIRQMLQQRVYKELRQYVQTDTKERLPEAGDSQKKLYELQPDGWRISGA